MTPIQYGIRLTADGAQAAGEMQRVGRRVGDVRQELDAMSASASANAGAMRSLTGTLGSYAAAAAAAFGGRQIVTAADEWGQIASRIGIAAGSTDAAAEASERLMEVSNRTYKSFGNSAELYIRTSGSLAEMSYSADQALGMVEALQYGLTVSSANQERATSVIDAWSKSILNGKMGLEEYQTVVAGAPRLQKALADSLGLTTAELQQMARDGKLSTDVLVGVTSQVGRLGEEADRMPVTMADGWQRFNNQLSKFAGEAESNLGAIRTMTSGVQLLGDNLDVVATVAGGVAVVALARYTGALAEAGIAKARDLLASRHALRAEVNYQQGLASTAAAQARAALGSAAVAAAREREAGATTAAAAAQARMVTGATLARGALAALGGPIGALITALGVAAIAWTTFGDRAESAADRAAHSIDAALERVRRLKAEMQFGTGDVGVMNESLERIDERLQLLNQSRSPGATTETEKLIAQRREIEDALNEIETGGMAARQQANARYATYLNERRSLSERLKADLETEAQAFAGATRNLQKDSTEYAAALEAYNRKTAEIREQYAKKGAVGRSGTRKTAAAVDMNLGEDTAAADAYARAMEDLLGIQRAAGAEGQDLTRSQAALRELMLSPEWSRMPQPWRDLVRAQADSATAAEATGAYQRTLAEIDAGLRDAAKSTMDLDAATSALYDLMTSPAWLQMTQAEREAAAARAETASATLAEIELERALQAARAQSATAAGARLRSQIDYVNQQFATGRFGAAGNEDTEKARREVLDALTRRGGQMETSIAASVARGLASGIATGGSVIDSLGDALQRTLMQKSAEGLEKGISKALDIASVQIADLFGSSGGGSSLWSGILSLFSARGNAFAGAGPVRAFAAGGAFGAGEVLTRPTLFRFADGAAYRSGVAGEAGPEAALPLKRMQGGKLGVYADFAGMPAAAPGPIYVSIAVNADGSGRSEATTSGRADASSYAELGRRLEGTVRGVLVAELRPGGLLSK
ncbi:tape measure protein [Thauera sinica]|uniref:Tape measure protein n=1 Tax=Thauera sinica TaxID=2665146 RepID=A0ABW1ARB0_9RHOO|nr:tape measure protein [Thauera sp. K11]ATE60171.1 hypothetical protein CCZ27_09610 [Thauera sp. K11]